MSFQLRDYQQLAVDSIFKEWEENTSTLLVLPTGAGKTCVFTKVIERVISETGKRVIVLVHRAELVSQAVEKIAALGVSVGIEKANLYVHDSSLFDKVPVVVSTIQTQVSGKENDERMFRFKPNEFGLVVVDEAHHSTSDSWVKTINYYKNNPSLKVLGVTATPDRADEEALGQVFQSVAFDYEIVDAIRDGWLVPIKQQMVTIEDLDFSQMRTTAGDLNGADLAAVMESEKSLHGVTSASIDIIGNRRTIVFACSVKQAEMYSDIFNRHRSGMSDWVCGKTSKEDRESKLVRFKSGDIQIMVNVGVLTEGFDSPGVEVIIQARPTKSRSLYSQMVGRSTRPLPGIVDFHATPEARRNAIAISPKPSCLVVDFVGNSGRHKLVTSADILGGKFSDEEIELAEKTAKEKTGVTDMMEELEKAKEELEKRRLAEARRKAHILGKARYSTANIDPFDVLQIKPERERGWDSGKTLTEKQREFLLKNGIKPEERSYHANKQILVALFKRIDSKSASYKQVLALQKKGYDTKGITFKQASDIMDSLAKNGWSKDKADAYRASREQVAA